MVTYITQTQNVSIDIRRTLSFNIEGFIYIYKIQSVRKIDNFCSVMFSNT